MARWRLWTIFTLIVVAFVAIAARLFYWQIIQGERLRVEAANQYALALELPPQRGSILAADGAPLVLNKQAYLIWGAPQQIADIPVTSRAVAGALGMDEATISAALSIPERVWVPLAHKVPQEKGDALAQLDLDGIGMEDEPVRYYVESSMAAHLLGFVGSDQYGRDKGYFGIEGYYDRELRGKAGVMKVEKDARGSPILVGEATRIDAQDGRDLVLWLNRSMQHIAETKLLSGIQKYGASEGSVVIMDPQTGGILAMASYPNYDPTDYQAFNDGYYKNPVVAGFYEPGSTFKTLVMAAAIEEGLLDAKTTIEETGPVKIGQYLIKTWNDKYNGTITMTEVLENSSNVGMVYVGKQLGIDRMIAYLTKLGFGEPTGIDLEEESSPDIRPASDWREIDLATASFGQGIAVTRLQMVRAVAAIANDGWLMEPRIVRAVIDEQGNQVEFPTKKIRRVFSPATTDVLTEMMVSAVDNGDARWVRPENYRVAGKTGTAQIPVAGHYDEEKTIASFVGFAPADNPSFVMLVTLKEPSTSPWGSETAAPLFFDIANEILTFFPNVGT